MHHKETLYFEDVQEGQEISYTRTTTLMEWNRFAGANEEFVTFHMDDDAGKAMGNTGAFGMGNYRFLMLHRMLDRWIGRDGWIKKVGCQYRGFNYKGDVVTAAGKVINKRVENGQHIVTLQLSTKNQDGQETAPGNAEVVLPSRSG